MLTTHETVAPVAASELMAPALVDRIQRRAVMVAVVLGVATIIGAVVEPEQFFRSYLVGYMMWLGATLGGLALLMMQYLTKGNWGFVLRRQLEAASRNVPLMALLFVPLAIAIWNHRLYPWLSSMSPEDAALPKFQQYLTVRGMLARAVVYFLVWFLLQFQLNRWGSWQDQRDEPDLLRSRRYQKLAGPGFILYALTITLAATDWVMSLDPHWYSTMFGLIIIVGQGIIAMSLCLLLNYGLRIYRPVSEMMQPLYWHDLGNLLLAMVMLFAYISFGQFLIIWSGNLPEEIEWYMNRLHGGWGVWASMIVLFHFAVPFFLLLMKWIKRRPERLVWIAALMFVMRYADLFWYTMPNFPAMAGLAATRGHFHYSWLDIVAPAALGGIWVAAFCRQLKKRPLYPIYDLLWPEVTKVRHGH